jgi:hypothetical protein
LAAHEARNARTASSPCRQSTISVLWSSKIIPISWQPASDSVGTSTADSEPTYGMSRTPSTMRTSIDS